MRVIELVIEEENDGINAISVVDYPAIQENFIALSEQIEVELKEIDKEKRILLGAALIPDKKILRKDDKGEFYVFFSEDTVRKASELFFINGNQSKATEQHARVIKDMTVVESWIVEDPQMDKSNHYGLSVPKGTWMISMKCNNDKVWGKVQSGEIKGFSIEGYFADRMEMQKKEEIINQLKSILCQEQSK